MSKIIEIVLFKTNEGVNHTEFQADMKRWNRFLVTQKGFISRKAGISADGYYADITYWTDLEAPKIAGENADQNPEMLKLFESNMTKIDEKTLKSDFFEINNEFFVETSTENIADIFFFRPKNGVKTEEFEIEMKKFNATLADYKGLISRTNGVSADGEYLELVYWTDFEAIKSADEKGAETSEIEDFFTQMTDENSIFSNRFEIFSDTKNQKNENI